MISDRPLCLDLLLTHTTSSASSPNRVHIIFYACSARILDRGYKLCLFLMLVELVN